MMLRGRRQGGDDGFTLVELLVVVVVLGILAGIVVFGVGRFRTDANAGACRADVAGVNAAADAYLAITGEYPRAMADLTVGQYLKTGPKSGTFAFDATSRTAIREPACAAGESAVGAGPATTSAAATTPAATTSAAPPGSAAPTTSGSAAGACTAAVRIDNFWPQGFQAAITVTNTGTAARSPWTVSWQMRPSTSVNNAWNATVSQSGALVTAAAPDWNATLAPGATVSIGFIADGPASPLPFAVGLDGVTCTS